MAGVFIIADHIISPLGNTTADNFAALKQGQSGIKQHLDATMASIPFYASLFETELFKTNSSYTKFEQLLIASVKGALDMLPVSVPTQANTGLIISSTKGNISLLETEPNDTELKKRIALHTSGNLVARHFGFVNKPVVISNACTSGILAIITAKRLIEAGIYQTVVVTGADVITRFVLSGFQSFNAISSQPCRPFDADRDGITLGEGAATIILSSNPEYGGGIQVAGGATSNDANHISAPSRTGHELAQAINTSLTEGGLTYSNIDFISAHGTATVYNDEMEAKALNIASLNNVPVNSLKGFYGHTLGAAGLMESIIAIQCLQHNLILPTPGFSQMGVPTPVNICTQLTNAPLKNVLKTASGFGGCNGAVIFSKTH